MANPKFTKREKAKLAIVLTNLRNKLNGRSACKGRGTNMAKPRKTKTIEVDAYGVFTTTCVIHGNEHSPTRTLVGHPWVKIGEDLVQIGCIIITDEALNEIIRLRSDYNAGSVVQTGDYGRPEDI